MDASELFGDPPDTNPISDHEFRGNFDSFKIVDPRQEEVVALLQRLAGRVIDYGPKLLADENPFKEGRFLSIWGMPGRGKSHLVEGFVNLIKADNPAVLSKVFYSSPSFNTGGFNPAVKPIVIIDDMYSHDTGALSVRQLPEKMVRHFMGLATVAAEHNLFVLMTCNYPLLAPMFKRLKGIDQVGRSTSRLTRLVAASKEIQLHGKDYRAVIASERAAEAGDEFDI